MRTTIDMPDHLLGRLKQITVARKTTFRSLVIDALERTLTESPQNFRLRDASMGPKTSGGKRVSTSTINKTIDQHRNGS
jgi:metal-responsive CopG/Arc/MetJ family transcriptional regulator